MNTSDFARKAQFPLMLAAGAFPLLALIVLKNAPQTAHALAALIPTYLLFAWACMLLPGKARIPAGLCGCAALFALGFRILPILSSVTFESGAVGVSPGALTLLIPLLLSALLLYGLPIGAWPPEQEIAFNAYAVGLFIHLFVQFISFAERRLGSDAWQHMQGTLVLSFIAFLLLVMLSMNRLAMRSAAQARQRVPLVMKRRNTAITLALLAIALLLAAIPAMAQALRILWSATLSVLRIVSDAILAFLGDAVAPSGGGGGGGSEPMLVGMEMQEPSLLAVVLEKIIMAVALLFAFMLLVLALRIAGRKLLSLIKALIARLGHFAAAASQDYVDEITDTREDGGQTDGTLRERLARRMAFVNERRLTPAERIRHRYRRLLSRHPDWRASSTARENLAPDTAALYEQARYSGRASSPEDAERFLRSTDRQA